MSIGGDFYSITDDQLKRILAGTLDAQAFFGRQLPEKPTECFSEGEHVWHELTQLLDSENGCGVGATEIIPLGGAYSYSPEVRKTADALPLVSKEELHTRFLALDTTCSFSEVYPIVLGLVLFYRRAALTGHAVFFHIH